MGGNCDAFVGYARADVFRRHIAHFPEKRVVFKICGDVGIFLRVLPRGVTSTSAMGNLGRIEYALPLV